MKKIQLILFSLLLGATSIMISSCAKDDPCKDVKCGDHGQCAEGVCICDVGYEKDATTGECSVEQRAKFFGTYQGSETCTVGTDNYSITLASSASGIDKVVLSNVYNQGVTLTGSVNGTSLTIAAQSVTVGASTYTFSGTGTYTAGTPPTIKIEYSIQGTPSNSCIFTGQKL
ncbi:MAG TPA: hypothetical protein VK590_04770 [Saprospiraceae bacterium]|nr:hypothetical protein [Saprospiraceae bacterium]